MHFVSVKWLQIDSSKSECSHKMDVKTNTCYCTTSLQVTDIQEHILLYRKKFAKTKQAKQNYNNELMYNLNCEHVTSLQ